MSAKSEKQAIDAKIAKVREVFKHLSKNDILLALHSYEMDVNRTIQALTMDVGDALGEWNVKGNDVKKTKKNKNKGNATAASDSAATSTTTETPKLSSVNSRPATAKAQPAQQQPVVQAPPAVKPDPKAAKAFGQLGEEEKQSELEALLHELDVKSARIQKNIDSAHNEQSTVIAAIHAALSAREHQLFAYLEATRKQVETQVQQQRSTIQKLKQNPKSAGEDYARLKASLDSLLETNLTVYGDKAIKAIEKLGSGFLPAEAVNYPAAPVVRHQQVNGTPSQQPKSTQPAAQPQLNGKPAQQPAKPQQNGKHSNKPLNGTDIKHSISHSSLATSEENDSGLGQISPVSQEKNAVAAQVAKGGFSFASEGLDHDQVEKLKAQVTETLKAQGIDPDIIASITSGSTASRPRNRPRKDNANGKPVHKENKKPVEKAVKS